MNLKALALRAIALDKSDASPIKPAMLSALIQLGDAAPAIVALVDALQGLKDESWLDADDTCDNEYLAKAKQKARQALEDYVPPPPANDHLPMLKVGTRVLSIEGEMSDTGAGEVRTGPNAVGVICAIDDGQEHGISLAFKPSEVSVFLSRAELADATKYTINPDMGTYANLAVLGRIDGDDEDTVTLYHDLTAEAAQAAFIEDMHAEAADNQKPCNAVYVNYVLTSATPIEITVRNVS